MKRRSLICRSEDARHPFRQMLAPAVLDASMLEETKPAKKEGWWRKEDTHLFFVSFSAFFVVFYTFIA